MVDHTTALKHQNRKKAFCVLGLLLFWHFEGVLVLLPCRLSLLLAFMIGGILSEKCCVLLCEYPNKPTGKWYEKMLFYARCSRLNGRAVCAFSLMLYL
jgi:hypothetical protein